MILATNGIPEEKTKRELVFRCFIKKKKKKNKKEKRKGKNNLRILELWRYLTITSSFRNKREHNVDMEYRYLFTTHINKV